MRDIQGTRLFDDFEKFVHGVYETVAATQAQRALNQRSEELRRLEKLTRLELSFDDWTELQQDALDNQGYRQVLERDFSTNVLF